MEAALADPAFAEQMNKLIQEGITKALQQQQNNFKVMQAQKEEEERNSVVALEASKNKRTRDGERKTSLTATSPVPKLKSLIQKKLTKDDPHAANKIWTSMEVCLLCTLVHCLS